MNKAYFKALNDYHSELALFITRWNYYPFELY